MRYTEAVEMKRNQREFIRQFNKPYYERHRTAKGLENSDSHRKPLSSKRIPKKGDHLYTKNGTSFEVVKVIDPWIYLQKNGKTFKGPLTTVGQELFFRKG